MSLDDLSATCIIDGNSLSGYIQSVNVRGALCAPGATAEVRVARGYPSTLQPGQSATVSLSGTLVLTGSVVSVDRERAQETISVGIADEYIRVARYFNTDQTVTEVITPCSTLIGQILAPTGINYSIQAADFNTPPGAQIGLRFAHEALFDVLTYMTAYAYPDPDGTLIIKNLQEATTTHTISSGIINYERNTSDETTRNVIKVFGQSENILGERIFATASRAVSGISPDRVAVVGSPLIETQGEAQRVATYLVNELGSLTDVVTVDIAGNPDIQIGHKASITYQGVTTTDVVTSLEHDLNPNGFVTQVVIGERCPRIAGWSLVVPAVYAGTSGSGVFRSIDAGITWTSFNTGLPSGHKYVHRLAFNFYDEGMAIVNNRIYHYDAGGSTWVQRTLPSPTNTAGDSPAPSASNLRLMAVDSTGLAGEFNLLGVMKLTSGSATQDGRSWVYNTTDGGSNWTSTQLYSSGSSYHIIGIDLSSKYGTPYVTATTEPVFALPGGILIKSDLTRVAYVEVYDVPPIICDEPHQLGCDVGVMDYELMSSSVTGSPGARNLNLVFRMTYGIFGIPSANVSLQFAFGKKMGDELPFIEPNAFGAGVTQSSETCETKQVTVTAVIPEATAGSSFEAVIHGEYEQFMGNPIPSSPRFLRYALTGNRCDTTDFLLVPARSWPKAGWFIFDFE